MKDTVEVRLMVPRAIHEWVVKEAKKNWRTTQAQYIYLLYMAGEVPKPAEIDYNGPG